MTHVQSPALVAAVASAPAAPAGSWRLASLVEMACAGGASSTSCSVFSVSMSLESHDLPGVGSYRKENILSKCCSGLLSFVPRSELKIS